MSPLLTVVAPVKLFVLSSVSVPAAGQVQRHRAIQRTGPAEDIILRGAINVTDAGCSEPTS